MKVKSPSPQPHRKQTAGETVGKTAGNWQTKAGVVRHFLESAVYAERPKSDAWKKLLLINCRYFIENVLYASQIAFLAPITSHERCSSTLAPLQGSPTRMKQR
jgi:hypothetical protein